VALFCEDVSEIILQVTNGAFSHEECCKSSLTFVLAVSENAEKVV
jgi:hypothetical protein